MQTRNLERLTKLPQSDTAMTLAILQDERQELSKQLIASRNPHETVRLQGTLEFLDKLIAKLSK
ncbi:MAG: hypothetical protein KGV51_01005 [Moraxellaceae bacterium]|nr:hypothetical protein [Moraxellaceae bacterium]